MGFGPGPTLVQVLHMGHLQNVNLKHSRKYNKNITTSIRTCTCFSSELHEQNHIHFSVNNTKHTEKKTLHCGRSQRAYVYRVAVNGPGLRQSWAGAFLIKPQTDLVYMPGQSWRDFSNVLYERKSVAVDMHLNEDPCRRIVQAGTFPQSQKRIFSQVVVNKYKMYSSH